MARTITLRLSDEAYESAKRHAEADRQSVSTWIESLLDLEDTRRRCATHGRWLSANPVAVAFAESWADRNLEELAQR
jgi:hypothetical protein